ncbi:MAG: thioredoxin TrxC [Rhodobacteraceae bacterium]|nr:thioredoxin TrxC [Paracoccaceae bacterium]
MGKVKMVCHACGAANRLPEEKLADGPRCGVCGAALVGPKVHDLDLATLEKSARTDEVPLVVDFWASWCGPCRMMAPEFAKAAQAMTPDVRFAKINTESHPDASIRYQIRGIPALILFHRGREVARHAGAMRAGQIEAWIRSSVAPARRTG